MKSIDYFQNQLCLVQHLWEGCNISFWQIFFKSRKEKLATRDAVLYSTGVCIHADGTKLNDIVELVQDKVNIKYINGK